MVAGIELATSELQRMQIGGILHSCRGIFGVHLGSVLTRPGTLFRLNSSRRCLVLTGPAKQAFALNSAHSNILTRPAERVQYLNSSRRAGPKLNSSHGALPYLNSSRRAGGYLNSSRQTAASRRRCLNSSRLGRFPSVRAHATPNSPRHLLRVSQGPNSAGPVLRVSCSGCAV